ncbi:Arc-like DNA binding domain-containing protein, partial [Dysosmobacter welbionis]
DGIQRDLLSLRTVHPQRQHGGHGRDGQYRSCTHDHSDDLLHRHVFHKKLLLLVVSDSWFLFVS